jgi:hypothetical protein
MPVMAAVAALIGIIVMPSPHCNWGSGQIPFGTITKIGIMSVAERVRVIDSSEHIHPALLRSLEFSDFLDGVSSLSIDGRRCLLMWSNRHATGIFFRRGQSEIKIRRHRKRPHYDPSYIRQIVCWCVSSVQHPGMGLLDPTESLPTLKCTLAFAFRQRSFVDSRSPD